MSKIPPEEIWKKEQMKPKLSTKNKIKKWNLIKAKQKKRRGEKYQQPKTASLKFNKIDKLLKKLV